MALNVGTVKAHVELSGAGARIIALQHAVSLSAAGEAPAAVVERAETFRAFLEPNQEA